MAADRESIASFFEQISDAWKTNNGDILADCFTEDASLINPFGERADGRTAVGAMYSTYFQGLLAGTTSSIAVQSVRAVGDDHALVDVDQTITGADGAVVMDVHLAALLRRDGDGWRLVDARPCLFPPVPG
jgi:uncharacterized protein (TIGR02246 family)